MKKIKGMIGAIILSSSFLYADTCASYCFEDSWNVNVEWLYLLNAIDQPYFAQEGLATELIGLDRHATEQHWHSAYRVEGVYSYCNQENGVRLRWTHLPQFSETGQFIEPSQVMDTIGLPTLVELASFYNAAYVHNSFYFYSAELLFEQQFCPCAPFSFVLEGGVQFARIHMEQDIQYIGDISNRNRRTTRFQSDRYGVGPEIGFQFAYPFCGCFNWLVRGNSSLLVAKKKTKYATQYINGSTNVRGNGKDDGYWILMPYIDLRTGLSYLRNVNWCSCAFSLGLEVGYEVFDYFKGVDNVYTFQLNRFPSSSINNYMSFMQHGPYVRLGVTF